MYTRRLQYNVFYTFGRYNIIIIYRVIRIWCFEINGNIIKVENVFRLSLLLLYYDVYHVSRRMCISRRYGIPSINSVLRDIMTEILSGGQMAFYFSFFFSRIKNIIITHFCEEILGGKGVCPPGFNFGGGFVWLLHFIARRYNLK